MLKQLIVLAISLTLVCSVSHAEQFKSTGTIDVYFSPAGGATEAIVKEIDSAKTEILVQAYSFASKPIAKALVDAHKRGIKIEVVLDKSQRRDKYTPADFVANAGIFTYVDDKHAIANNRVMVLDQTTLITGCFSFNKAAEEKNVENLLVIKGNQPLVDSYRLNFIEHKKHSIIYQGK